MAYNSLNEDFLKMLLNQGAGKIGRAQLHSMHLMSSVTVSKYSIRSQKQKQKNGSNTHSQCAAVLLTNHDSNLYLLNKIVIRHTVINA